MLRLIPALIVLVAAAACDSAPDLVAPSPPTAGTLAIAAAGQTVDPATLVPMPPPGAKCKAGGQWIICHTGQSDSYVNAPAFDLSCGTIYETATDVRAGIRWYNTDRLLEKRHVTQQLQGTWSLSPDGRGPTVTLTAHQNWSNLYTTPGDPESGEQPTRGVVSARAPGYGVIAHIAGLNADDAENGHGTARFIDDPAVAAELCAALTP